MGVESIFESESADACTSIVTVVDGGVSVTGLNGRSSGSSGGIKSELSSGTGSKTPSKSSPSSP